ncbi:hypothetical protein E2C01_069710 [Portunus trituberculatus]|uniref:Uncharacterized protein n=1 Tax=Portunus trituberculatus TaxID=210409 RepID=A0A5B7I3J3_PORTR|nr:hypothetical protein [Portunus trituberculatus]
MILNNLSDSPDIHLLVSLQRSQVLLDNPIVAQILRAKPYHYSIFVWRTRDATFITVPSSRGVGGGGYEPSIIAIGNDESKLAEGDTEVARLVATWGIVLSWMVQGLWRGTRCQ